MVAKGHRKKKSGRKAEKKKAASKAKAGGDAIDAGINDANPRAFQLASKGKARVQRARTAEKEQRRLHGAMPPPFALPLAHLADLMAPLR